MKISIESTPVRSPKPEKETDKGWGETEIVCPDCGQLIWQAPWWDDLLENGGAWIGTHYECGNCGYCDSV
jgi:predicted RNA-binding Zn-ribbon protein involved in translation (DUF1610 family)